MARMAENLQEAAMRERYRSRPVSVIANSLLAACLIPLGCAPDSSALNTAADEGLQGPRLNAETRSGPAEISQQSQADTLASQAERDAEILFQLQNGSERMASLAPNEIPIPEPPDTGSNIQWNTPGSVGSRYSRQRPEDRTEQPIVQKPLARDSDEAVEIKSLPDEPQGDAHETVGNPVDILASDRLKLLMVDLRRDLYRQSIDSDQPIRELILLAAMSMVDPDAAIQPDVLHQLTDDEKVLLARLQAFFETLGTNLDDSNESEQVIRDAVAALQKAMVQADLELPTAELCYRVGGFGDYGLFDKNSFLATSGQQVILYLEIDGFQSELNKENRWVTEVSQRIEIINDSDGIPVGGEPWQKAVDVSSQKRRDFFTTQIVTLPEALSVGKYYMKIHVRDEKSGAEYETSIEFQMVADAKFATSIPR